MELWGEFWVRPTIRSYFSAFLLAMANSRFKFSFSCSVSARMAASCAGLFVDGGEGPEVRTEGRGFRGEVVMGVLEEGRGPDEVIVIVDIVDGSDSGGGSVGRGGGCGALMEEGLGEAVDIDLDDADDSQDDDGRG